MRFSKTVRTVRAGWVGILVAVVVGLAISMAAWLGSVADWQRSVVKTPLQPLPVLLPVATEPLPRLMPDVSATRPESSPGASRPAAVTAVILLADADYLPRILTMIGEARQTIDITMFSCVLPDDARPDHPVRRLLEALVTRAQSGVAVRVVFDHGVPPSRRQPHEQVPSAVAARWLADRSIAIRWDEDGRTTHTKSLVIDQRWCVVGSTNWSFSALRRNREQSLLLDDLVLAASLTQHFDALWNRATPVVSPTQR